MSTSQRTIGAGQPVAVFEIAQDAFKILMARGSRGQVMIDDLHIQKVEGGGAALVEAIAAAVRGMNLSRYHAIGCLPRQIVNIRTLELPSTDPDEIADMVDFQAAKQTPYSKEEILSDYRVIGSRREGYTKVMLVIVQRSALRQYFYLLDELGVDVEWMAVSSEGVLNWFRRAGGAQGAEAILDVDSHYSDFMMVTDGDVVFSRCIRMGAARILAQPESAWHELTQEIRPLLETCRTEHPGLNLDRLTLTGAGARMSGLGEHLQAALNIPVGVRDETASVRKMPAAVEAGELRSLSLTSLIGIAQAPDALQINLMPDSIKLRQDLVTKARNLGAVSTAAMGLLVAGSLYVLVEYSLEREQGVAIKARAERLEPARRNAERMFEICRIVREYRNPQAAMANMLAEVHPLVPPDLYLETLEIDVGKGRGALSGSGGSMKDVRSLMTGLEKSPLFADVKEDGPLIKDPRSGRFKFRVGCVLEKPR